MIITYPNAPKSKPADNWVAPTTKMWIGDDGLLHHRREQDIEPILKRNAEKRAENRGWRGEFYEVGEVPGEVFIEWLNELGVTYAQWARDPELKAKTFAKLRERENNKFRTKEGKI